MSQRDGTARGSGDRRPRAPEFPGKPAPIERTGLYPELFQTAGSRRRNTDRNEMIPAPHHVQSQLGQTGGAVPAARADEEFLDRFEFEMTSRRR